MKINKFPYSRLIQFYFPHHLHNKLVTQYTDFNISEMIIKELPNREFLSIPKQLTLAQCVSHNFWAQIHPSELSNNRKWSHSHKWWWWKIGKSLSYCAHDPKTHSIPSLACLLVWILCSNVPSCSSNQHERERERERERGKISKKNRKEWHNWLIHKAVIFLFI